MSDESTEGPSDKPGTPPVYRRVLLKVSGEALMDDNDYGIDPATVSRIADDVIGVCGLGVEVCVVVGGGNININRSK